MTRLAVCRRRARGVAAAVGMGVVVILSGTEAAGQQRATVRGGAIFERYTFGAGLGFDAIDQVTIPVVVSIPLGARAGVTLASGWARVEMGLEGGGSRVLSGILDTEARVSVTLVRDRLRLLLSGSAPTGIGSVAEDDVVLLGPLSNDLLAFASPTLGTGGAVGIGLAGALPAGAASVGYAVNVRLPLSYEPVLGTDDEVRAGNELRLRLGVERPVGRRAFFRAAGIASIRQRDRLNGAPVNAVGNRFAGYGSLDVPLAGAVGTVWASGLYRSDPTLESTAVGAAFVPRGTLLAAGARLVVGLGPRTRLEPHLEYRTAAAAPDAAGLELEELGDVVRFGARLRRSLGGAWLVAEGEGLTGSVRSGLVDADTRGFRASLFVEWVR